MHSNDLSCQPIGYTAIILVTVNVLGYIAVTHFELYSASNRIKSIDTASSYVCYGLSFAFVTTPIIAAPGAFSRNKISAGLIFVWTILYVICIDREVFYTLSISNEIEWIRWVFLSFLCLLPHTMGLTRLVPGNFNLLMLGFLVSAIGLMMMTHSLWLTVTFIPVVNDEDESIEDGALRLQWSTSSSSQHLHNVHLWANWLVWFGIFLLNTPAMTDAQSYVTSTHKHSQLRQKWFHPRLILAFLCGPGLLFIMHPQMQSCLIKTYLFLKLDGLPILQSKETILNPLDDLFLAASVDPTLLRISNNARSRDAFTSELVDASDRLEEPNVTYLQTENSALTSYTRAVAIGTPSTTARLPQPEIALNSAASSPKESHAPDNLRMPEVPKTSPFLNQPIAKMDPAIPKGGIKPEEPIAIIFEESPTKNIMNMFLSKFKLKITTDLLNGQWD
jgi:hypothetical protein